MSATGLMVLLFVAGLVGGGARAWFTRSQNTLSAKSAADVVLGACFGIFVPRLAANITVWTALSPLEQFVAVVIASYAFGDVIQNTVLARMKVFVDMLGPAPQPPRSGNALVLLTIGGSALLLAACGTSQEQLVKLAVAFAEQQYEIGKTDAVMEAYCAPTAKVANDPLRIQRCTEYAVNRQERQQQTREIQQYVADNKEIDTARATQVLIRGSAIAAKGAKIAIGVPSVPVPGR